MNGISRGPFQKTGGLVVGSKDVQAHYPEIDIYSIRRNKERN